MELPPPLRGVPWCLHVALMVLPWDYHGPFVEFRDASMVLSWTFMIGSMAPQRCFHGRPWFMLLPGWPLSLAATVKLLLQVFRPTSVVVDDAAEARC